MAKHPDFDRLINSLIKGVKETVEETVKEN